jgi:hypothetical protein
MIVTRKAGEELVGVGPSSALTLFQLARDGGGLARDCADGLRHRYCLDPASLESAVRVWPHHPC